MAARSPVLRLLPLFRGSEGLLASGLAGLLLATAAAIAGPWLVARAIDTEMAQGDLIGLGWRTAQYAGLLVLAAGSTWAAHVGLEIAAQRAMLALKLRLFDHLVTHDLAFHDRQPSGRLITRVQGDTEALRLLFADVVLSLPADLALFLGMFAVTAVSAPQLLGLVFGVAPGYLLLFVLFRWIAPRSFLKVRSVRAVLTGFLAEHIRALPVLQTFGREAWVRDRADAHCEAVYRAEVIAGLHPVWYFNTVIGVQRLGMIATLLGGGAMVAAGTSTLGDLVLGLGYLRLMFQPLMRLSNQLATLERARAAAVRVTEILDDAPRIVSPDAPTPWPGLKQALRLEAVDFRYGDGPAVLHGIDLEIPAGSNTGIVGATGAGKSTVLNLLFRFRDPSSGRLTVDGVDLRDLALRDLRDRIGLVQQDVHLFPGTLLDNLGGTPEAARAALDAVGLSMPLDQPIRDGGSNLSRGERQLFTLARALVGDPEILVLDEATSAVDPATERTVQQALARASQGRTTIAVAHRLATVRDCDRIHVFADGRIRESGTHDELVARGGIYTGLARHQGLVA